MKWEYRSLQFDPTGGFFSSGSNVDASVLDRELNKMGAQGWELVSVFGVQDGNGRTDSLVATLKRAKEN